MTFSQILRKLMDERHLTNYQLAKSLDIHPSTVANWLEGKCPRKITMHLLADYFGVSDDYLKTGKEKTPVEKDERIISDDDIKFALFGGDGEVTDEMWEEAQFAAQLIKERYRKKKE